MTTKFRGSLRELTFLFLLPFLAAVAFAQDARGLAEQMLQAAATKDEAKIADLSARIEALAKPARGDRRAARTLNDEALKAFAENNFGTAASAFGRALQQDPADVEIANNYGFALLKARQYAQAQDALLAAIAMAPKRSAAWFNLATGYGEQGDQARSSAAFELALLYSQNKDKTREFLDKLVQDPSSAPALASAAKNVLAGPTASQAVGGQPPASPVSANPASTHSAAASSPAPSGPKDFESLVNCARAELAAEKAICASDRLKAFDVQFAEAFKRAKTKTGTSGELLGEIGYWVDEVRNKCESDAKCLDDAYQQGAGRLRSTYGIEVQLEQPTATQASPTQAQVASAVLATAPSSNLREPLQMLLVAVALLQLPITFWLVFKKTKESQGLVGSSIYGFSASAAVFVALGIAAFVLDTDEEKAKREAKREERKAIEVVRASTPATPATPEQTKPPIQRSVPAIQVGIGEILGSYTDNEVAADNKYKGKLVQVTGIVSDIKKDLLDDLYVAIGTGAPIEIPQFQAFFDKSKNSELAALQRGQQITVTCRVEGLMFNVLGRKCVVT